jgi:hypothetical protein
MGCSSSLLYYIGQRFTIRKSEESLKQNQNMLGVFLGMLGDLGGAFDRVIHKDERKRHNPAPRPEARQAAGYIMRDSGWRHPRRGETHRQRSRAKGKAKRAALKELSRGVSLPTARKIWRSLQSCGIRYNIS